MSFKLIMTMKKRADMSREDFISYYNTKHLPFMSTVLQSTGEGKRVHRRNFVQLDDPFLDIVGEGRAVTSNPDFDAVTEVIFENREDAIAMFTAFFDSKNIERIKNDERNFVQLDSVKTYVVEEHMAVRG